MTRIERFGWKAPVEPGIGRIVSAHGDYYHLVCNEAEGEILARKKKSAFRTADALRPITGDFVRFRYNEQGESMIQEVLPRFSSFKRKDPTARRKAQVLAVNFDVLFIMMSQNENFSIPRLERFLALSEECGQAEVVIALTKKDLAAPGESGAARVVAAFGEGKVTALDLSCRTGEGLETVRQYAQPGRTLAFIGSSGVGKSTLLNELAGEDWMATQEIQEWSGKGRHTTTSRELVMLPNGAMVIDTPGIREIGRIGEVDERLVKGEASHRYRK